MTEGQVLDIIRDSIYTLLMVSLPLLLVSLVIGLAISIFQTVTSIQEQTLTFIPKIVGVFTALMIFGPWMLSVLTDYINNLWANFSIYLG
ncbi:MAG: flagellar biosynthesis protein FliQ [Pseudobutyrivibrio sp.]|jgi:flagellar biosynthetic protein FliQ|uniref:Flagellar biosynthetic protein FliQ n=1 Tax=Pseudobutyrivibrio ruminis TaxID=46206 RepID=A0A2G3DVK2_9FIRM|nr:MULTISPECIES: flagellar biosynthesis protein FliQ [Pseudobutyrivibrio]MBE5902780.1 flagellar biosynthesis protein FliQ [Pseudobutyrivibrio sp.]PHU34890.1 flagellar biosynthetic protein FliQ [Pseudobutyrivibrio ruminis]PHU40006.1 flagellar biosynthetic protein FliQ [Pseudobutyrivibrio ruminis]SCX85898.1 flagellar biosynthetic protein FliQ [Pseudobutyrivibrio sp. AR14]